MSRFGRKRLDSINSSSTDRLETNASFVEEIIEEKATRKQGVSLGNKKIDLREFAN